MTFDASNMTDEMRTYLRGTVTVDGLSVTQVFYASEEAGVVRTYDLRGGGFPATLQDGKAHCVKDLYPLGVELAPAADQVSDLLVTPSGIIYRELRGNVKLMKPRVAPIPEGTRV